jgi:uncharacterized membrane protein
MRETFWRRLRLMTYIAAACSPVASHAALGLGLGYGAAMILAAVQAAALGLLVSSALPGRRWLGPLLSAIMLAALALGARTSNAAALLAVAGLAHAISYGALLAVFAVSMQRGRTSVVTRIARQLNPHFHAGMVPYTRAVTLAWCVFFAAQLAASAVLLATDPALWRAFVTTLHAPLVGAMAIGEFLVRRWRWRHEHYTSLRDTIGGMARVRWDAAAARTSRRATDCPVRSGSATRPLGSTADTGPGPAG